MSDGAARQAHDRAARARRRSLRRAARGAVPARVLGRHAPASDDRDGDRQRSDVLIADEPTTALDVTIQAQIVEVLKTAQDETHAATILITHDLGLDRGARRPRRRHVRGPGRRARRRLHDLRLAPPSVHGRPHEQPCQGRRRPGPPRADPRPAAEPDHAAAGMCVPPALRAVSRPRDLQDRHPRASRDRGRRSRSLRVPLLPRSSQSRDDACRCAARRGSR